MKLNEIRPVLVLDLKLNVPKIEPVLVLDLKSNGQCFLSEICIKCPMIWTCSSIYICFIELEFDLFWTYIIAFIVYWKWIIIFLVMHTFTNFDPWPWVLDPPLPITTHYHISTINNNRHAWLVGQRKELVTEKLKFVLVSPNLVMTLNRDEFHIFYP